MEQEKVDGNRGSLAPDDFNSNGKEDLIEFQNVRATDLKYNKKVYTVDSNYLNLKTKL